MNTPSKNTAPAHRLLYRGSLSLPDSHLLLDGLSFTVKLGDAHSSPALLNNTLALTLESLRGLPLHLIGTVRMKDTWIEPLRDINMYGQLAYVTCEVLNFLLATYIQTLL